MPEITILDITLLAVMLIGGGVLGWIVRANRCASEKATINAGWKEQLSAQRTEHERLVHQNRSLMQQISQYQASGKDQKKRAKELAGALKEASDQRNVLQRRINDIRNDFAAAVGRCDELQQDIDNRSAQDVASAEAIKQRNEKIFLLSRELESWQNRLPPLLEKFRERNETAERLERELALAREQIDSLETMIGSENTRVLPVNRDTLRDDLDASNDPSETVLGCTSASSYVEERGNVSQVQEIEASVPQSLSKYDANRESADTIGGLRDNLQLIKGIGPSIEKILNEMGIFRFGQIADMSEFDIDRVADRLKGFHSRIYREDWIGQARELRDQQPDDRS